MSPQVHGLNFVCAHGMQRKAPHQIPSPSPLCADNHGILNQFSPGFPLPGPLSVWKYTLYIHAHTLQCKAAFPMIDCAVDTSFVFSTNHRPESPFIDIKVGPVGLSCSCEMLFLALERSLAASCPGKQGEGSRPGTAWYRFPLQVVSSTTHSQSLTNKADKEDNDDPVTCNGDFGGNEQVLSYMGSCVTERHRYYLPFLAITVRYYYDSPWLIDALEFALMPVTTTYAHAHSVLGSRVAFGQRKG